jgi:glycerol-3-phosphate O-acyltransferase
MLDFLSERPLRIPRLGIYKVPEGAPPIFRFNLERDEIVRTVVDRVLALHEHDVGALEFVLNDAAYHEIRRLESQRDREAEATLPGWRLLLRSIARMSDDEKRVALRRVVQHMARDVAGNFDPRVYELARHGVPKLLTGVMRPSRLPRELVAGGSPELDQLLTVQGDVERLRALEAQGTLVYVPTHSSNLDSIVLAYALERSGLAPVTYGAGKNLFTNPIVSFFMHNLGAYRVDRRIRAHVYKDVLKTYSSVMIERGYHSLFFPGGTRSRSGMIERHLKLGLMGSAITAFAQNQVAGVDDRVYVVPTTINYGLVLEAETLIEDWLAERGRARYIIVDDEFSEVERWLSFFRKLVGLRAACVIRFGEPLDPFGNPIDAQGRSLSPSGGAIDPGSYVRSRGRPTLDAARDAAYTRGLGELLLRRYREDSVIMATQLVAHILFRRLVAETPGLDLYARLRLRGQVRIAREDLAVEIAEARDALLALRGEHAVRISPFLAQEAPHTILYRCLSMWSGYHRRVATRDDGRYVTIEDPTVLLYYQNRLLPFAEAIAPEALKVPARELGRLEAPW